MKKILKGVLGVVCVMSLFLACGEGETLSSQLVWTLSWLSVATVSGVLCSKMMTEEELNEKV
jgi:hypothetical protein